MPKLSPEHPREVLAARRDWVARRSDLRPRWRRGMIGADQDSGPAQGRGWGSRLLHRLGDVTAHSAAGLSVAAVVLTWVAVGSVTGFPSWRGTILQVVSSAVTLVMVFTIQHTQARQQSATQRKLDELLRAMPSADNRLIAVEEAADAELAALADLNLADRQQAQPGASATTAPMTPPPVR